jgi:hypothetical protein
MTRRVLATGTDHGMIQYISSQPLAAILAAYNNNLQAYMRATSPQPAAVESYGIDPAVMDAYVKSCAGYCVITYLLGVGDRHLDNLLLTPDGNSTINQAIEFRTFVSYRFWIHSRARPETISTANETVQGNGGRHGRYIVAALPKVQEPLLHRVHYPSQIGKLDFELVWVNARGQHSRHSSRARQDCT